MNILWKLSTRHLRLHKKRTAITVIGILLSVSMVTAISGMIVSFQDLLYRDAVLQEGLWHVRYYGLSDETVEKVVAEPIFSEYEIDTTGEGEPVVQLMFAKLNRRIFDQSDTICARYGISREKVQYHNNLLIAKGIVPGGYYEALYGFAAILLTLVAAGSVMVIGNAFSISAAERSRQFGLLKSAGATKGQIRDIVLLEGVALAAVGIPLGILAGILVEWVALTIANTILGGMRAVTFQVLFRVVLSPLTILAAVLAAMVTIFLASWFPARRAARVSPIDAIRQTAEIKIRPRNVRISPLVPRLFGFEGTLAAKTMKRGRGKYRTTVLSLVVSIVLFIGVSSFGDMLTKATSMAYEDYGSNLVISLYSEDQPQQDRIVAEISAWEGGEAYPSRSLDGGVELTEDMLTREVRDTMAAGWRPVRMHSLSDSGFEAVCRELGLDPEALRGTGAPAAILVNATGTYIVEGKRHSYTPYRLGAGDTLPVAIDEIPVELTIAGAVTEIPQGLEMRFRSSLVNLLVSEELRAALTPEDWPPSIDIPVMAEDTYAFEARAAAYLEAELGAEGWMISNYEEYAANNRNITMLVMIFIYGFIGMLSLIGVTNVITTISTGIALRRREFAMLRSVGITQPGIIKILTYENIIYGVKSLAIGLVIGNLASYLMYHSLGGAMSFAYIWPVSAMVASAVAVAVLVTATTLFAASRQRRDNIVDALRDEVA